MQDEMKIALLLYNGFTALDVAGPYEVLSKIPKATVYFVAEKKGLYADTKGLQLMADTSLEELPFPDMLVVPGGFGVDTLLTNETVLDWVRNAHEHSQWTVSVCSGALLLGAAGLLNDKKVTTHWNRKTQLAAYCPQILEDRYVLDGKVITSAGVSAGIDMALYLLSLITSETYAKTVQLGMEYDPQPPFHCGSPKTAPPELMEFVVNQRKNK
jgi:transcriptional regulator GlxA family with amidase domain